MKKVLILTYYWPPGSGPGVQRWLKFCKYLPALGWQPTVITVDNGSYPSVDPSLLDDVPSDLEVIRTKTFEPFALYNLLRGKSGKSVEVGMGNLRGKQSAFKRLANHVRANYFVPDARIGWNQYAIKAARKALARGDYNMLITTGPPHSTHLMGLELKQQFNIPWIMDMRDPWTTIYYNQLLNRNRATIEKDKKLEAKCAAACDLLIGTTPGIEAEFSHKAKRSIMVPNGFDLEDFEDVGHSLVDDGSMRISYVGNMKAVQDIPALWKALNQANKSADGRIRLSITGNISNEVRNSMEAAGIRSMVEVQKFVPHKEAIQIMASSHVLLLPIPKGESNRQIITGKIFEYLGCRRPIMSIGPKGGNADVILQACGHDSMLDYDDHEAMKKTLLNMFETFKTGDITAPAGNESYLKFSRKEISAQLADVLNGIA